MIIEYRDVTCPADIETDICVIGAGVAGLAVAREFIGTSVSVCVVAGGGASADDEYQSLYQGASIGFPEFDPAGSRMRAYGGTCNLWGRGCIPLGSTLDEREWVPHSGWPLSYEDLEPHYRNAREFCGIQSHDLGKGSFLTPPERAPLAFDERKLVNRIYAASPILFGSAYRSEFERAPNIQVLLHASVTELKAFPGGDAIEQARIASLDGKRGAVRARHFVLACGGIENARLMLLSNSVVPHGIGNDHDLVGRYFMDHPSGKLGTIFTSNPETVTRPYDRNQARGPAPSHPEISLSEQAQETHRILNARVRSFAIESRVPRGIRALRGLKSLREGGSREEPLTLEERLCVRQNGEPQYIRGTSTTGHGSARLALELGLGIGDIAMAFVRKLAGKPTVRTDRVDLVGYFEQTPNPDSRITLGEDRDALGQRKVCVDWRLTALDLHTYRIAAPLFGEEIARVCGGRFELEPWLSGEARVAPQVFGTSHHMGTTRMSTDPKQGVVDRDCRVHGVDNLHVAGSSVFPTGGWAFPTFTIVALGQRLAGRLRMLMRQSATDVTGIEVTGLDATGAPTERAVA